MNRPPPPPPPTPCWFTDYMSVSQSKLDSQLQTLNKNIQAVDIRLQNSVQVADLRFTALQQQIESVQQQINDDANAISNVEQKVDDNAAAILSVQQKVDDNANAILSVTTGFSKFSDTLMTVQCKLDALQNHCDQKMSTPATVGSDNTDMKRRSQSNRSVDTISTYSQQSTVCSTVVLEPLGFYLRFHCRLYSWLAIICMRHRWSMFLLRILPIKVGLRHTVFKIGLQELRIL